MANTSVFLPPYASFVTGAALSGVGSVGDPLKANVDGVTIDVNGSNQLEAIDPGLVDAFTSVPVAGQTTVTASGATALTFAAGSNVTLTTNNTTKTVTIAAAGGGGSPGGADTSIQFNDGGSFDGFGTWDGTLLTMPGSFALASGDASFTFYKSFGMNTRVLLASPAAFAIGDFDDATDGPSISGSASGVVIYGGASIPIGINGSNGDFIFSGSLTLDIGTDLKVGNDVGVTAGPFTVITGIQVKNGIVIGLTGS